MPCDDWYRDANSGSCFGVLDPARLRITQPSVRPQLRRKATFDEGDRVTMSDKGLAHGMDGTKHRRDGRFVRYSRDPEVIVVIRDGRRTPEYFSVDWWENCEYV